MAYTAFHITKDARAKILSRFQPKNRDVICHHVTENFGVPESVPAPRPSLVTVIGYACDDSLEALVVTVNGAERRPDGKRYHITLSLDRSQGRKPVESNDLIQAFGFDVVEKFDLGMMPGVVAK